MRKLVGDDIFHKFVSDPWSYLVVPTNGDLKDDDSLVMGAGFALAVAQRWPHIPKYLGKQVKQYGNVVNVLTNHRIISFPTKHSWRDKKADMKLIERSAFELREWGVTLPGGVIYLPRVGTGKGGLTWSSVEPVLSEALGERFIVVEP